MRFRINGTVYVGQAAKYMFTLKSPYMLFEVQDSKGKWSKYKK